MTESEINAECARRIGWHWHSELKDALCAPDQTCPLVSELIPVPNFHGSMDAAMQLVEFAKTLGYSLLLESGLDGTYECSFWHLRSKPGGGCSTEAESDSPSAAICLAFLEIPQ
jgi:hypothetical protein